MTLQEQPKCHVKKQHNEESKHQQLHYWPTVTQPVKVTTAHFSTHENDHLYDQIKPDLWCGGEKPVSKALILRETTVSYYWSQGSSGVQTVPLLTSLFQDTLTSSDQTTSFTCSLTYQWLMVNTKRLIVNIENTKRQLIIWLNCLHREVNIKV